MTDPTRRSVSAERRHQETVRFLARLYGEDISKLPDAGFGDCDDCGSRARRVRYSAYFVVCVPCALRRRLAMHASSGADHPSGDALHDGRAHARVDS
jgi:hypothetical protein